MEHNIEDEKFMTKRRFMVFVCYAPDAEDRALVLKKILGDDVQIGAILANSIDAGDLLTMKIKESIRSSICLVSIFTSPILISSIVGQERDMPGNRVKSCNNA